jgi:hypothetical protein
MQILKFSGYKTTKYYSQRLNDVLTCVIHILKTCNLCRISRLFTCIYYVDSGPGSSVGIVTGYGLDGPGIESRWGTRFSAPVQTGPGAHPATCTMGSGSFPGVESGRDVTLTPHPLLVPRSKTE